MRKHEGDNGGRVPEQAGYEECQHGDAGYRHNGFAIAVAWPETLCKQPGSWYDSLAGKLGISRNNYYRAGHAALVLVESETGRCHYFDFGRYHAPYQHGRVRNGETDPGLAIRFRARISADGMRIDNFREIMTVLQHNVEYHGDGTLYASYCKVNFELAYEKAIEMQAASPIAYGPFVYGGSNCSRFVNTCILAGDPDLRHRARLRLLVPLTPTPMNNVNSLTNKIEIPHLREELPSCPQPVRDKRTLKSTLPEPVRPSDLPDNAQWLSGEGAGRWFAMVRTGEHYLIRRFSPKGDLECENIFSVANNRSFDIDRPYRFEHISHCREVRLSQGGKYFDLMIYSSENHHQSDPELTDTVMAGNK